MNLPAGCVRFLAAFILLLPVSVACAADVPVLQSLAELIESHQPPGGPVPVRVGLVLEEVTQIDQRAENFSVVATLTLQWQDPDLAFQPESGEESFRIFRDEAFEKYVLDHGVRWPRFSFFNQQGKRFTQNKLVLLMTDGRALYLERFTVKLQASHLHFSKFPFDSQDFYINIDLLAPATFNIFTEQPGDSRLGEWLGLEEWDITRFVTTISKTHQVVGYDSSRFQFHFHAKRKTTYYKLRIIAPIVIIILMSWVIFFLQDYRKRIDFAAGNLLLLIAFNFTISNDLPRLSYLTFMDSILFTAFVITSMAVIVNVMLRYIEIHDRVELARRIDYFIIWTYPLLYVAGVTVAYKAFF